MPNAAAPVSTTKSPTLAACVPLAICSRALSYQRSAGVRRLPTRPHLGFLVERFLVVDVGGDRAGRGQRDFVELGVEPNAPLVELFALRAWDDAHPVESQRHRIDENSISADSKVQMWTGHSPCLPD